MKLGVLTVPLYDFSLEETLEYLHGLGVQAVELGYGGCIIASVKFFAFTGFFFCGKAAIMEKVSGRRTCFAVFEKKYQLFAGYLH